MKNGGGQNHRNVPEPLRELVQLLAKIAVQDYLEEQSKSESKQPAESTRKKVQIA